MAPNHLLNQQKSAFANSMASAAARLSKPTTAPALPTPPNSQASPTSVPSPQTDTGAATKRKREGGSRPDSNNNGGAQIYSQPENTGIGRAIFTQIKYIVDELKRRDEARSLQQIFDTLSLHRESEAHQIQIVETMRRHPQIQFIPDPALSEQTWRSGTYLHLPIIPHVKNKVQLLQFLQQRTDSQGVSVKDLKDGWPDCEAALGELEATNEVLVIRTKKDSLPRLIFPNVPSLCHRIDAEFQTMWMRVPIPPLDELPVKLVGVGQKPTGAEDGANGLAHLKTTAPNKNKAQQKKRTGRKSGKATNLHMEHLLKDYSNMKR